MFAFDKSWLVIDFYLKRDSHKGGLCAILRNVLPLDLLLILHPGLPSDRSCMMKNVRALYPSNIDRDAKNTGKIPAMDIY